MARNKHKPEEIAGLKVEQVKRPKDLETENARQPMRGRPWLAAGSCFRPRAEDRNHIRSDEIVADRTHEGGSIAR